MKLLVAILTFLMTITSSVSCAQQIVYSNTKEKEIKKPNVLIIYPDQLRRYSASFWSEEKYNSYAQGSPDPVLTPTMDKLANKGVVFTNAISNYPLCSPARGMLLTGQYPSQTGIQNNCKKGREDSLKDDVETCTDIFSKIGYNTAYFGKCHWLKNEPLFNEVGDYIGDKRAPGGHFVNNYDTYIPPGKSRHHIDYFYQSVRDSHFNPLVYSNDPNAIEGKKDGELYKPNTFSTKNEAEKIIGFLKNKNGVRDTNKPFFMVWSINPPHSPWDDKNTDMKVLDSLYGKEQFASIKSLLTRDNVDVGVADYVRNYYANVTSVDGYIGKVIDALDLINELDNTLIVLSSDHGEMLGSHAKKGKNTFETEAIAIPMIMHYPKKIKAGIINQVLFSVPDVLPTTLGVLGLKDFIPKATQGYDLSNSILSGDKSNASNETISNPKAALLILRNGRGVFTENYTLCILEKKQKKEVEIFLYDNKNDPYQLEKVKASVKPIETSRLLKFLGKELQRTNDSWFRKRKHTDLIDYDS